MATSTDLGPESRLGGPPVGGQRGDRKGQAHIEIGHAPPDGVGGEPDVDPPG